MKKLERKGFTVIEVVLVLAIAGLIFAMAFIALPALQRNQRDAQRRDDMATFVDALKKFQTNNRGALPEYPTKANGNPANNVTVFRKDINYSSEYDGVAWEDFYRNYLKESFMDPSGAGYNLIIEPCRSDKTPTTAANPRNDFSYVDNECQYSAGMNGNKMGLTFNNHYILVELEATCDNSHAVASNNPRRVAVMYAMEGSGVYCTNT